VQVSTLRALELREDGAGRQQLQGRLRLLPGPVQDLVHFACEHSWRALFAGLRLPWSRQRHHRACIMPCTAPCVSSRWCVSARSAALCTSSHCTPLLLTVQHTTPPPVPLIHTATVASRKCAQSGAPGRGCTPRRGWGCSARATAVGQWKVCGHQCGRVHACGIYSRCSQRAPDQPHLVRRHCIA
jgi:hypothetical protein